MLEIIESNLTINVSNLDTSISFYNSIGFTLQQRWGDYFAQLVAPGLVIGLHPASPEQLKGNSGNVSLGFATDNIEFTKFQLSELSIIVTERTEDGGAFLHFNDPDGTSLYFIKPKW